MNRYKVAILLALFAILTGCGEVKQEWMNRFQSEWSTASNPTARIAVCEKFRYSHSMTTNELRYLTEEITGVK